MNNFYKIKPIGVVHSSLKIKEESINFNTEEIIGEIEIFKEYEEGLCDIDGFSHIIVIFWMHNSSSHSLRVKPISQEKKLCGVFAIKNPDIPNPIGIAFVNMSERRGNFLKVKGMDMIDGTPILDIKTYIEGDLFVSANFV